MRSPDPNTTDGCRAIALGFRRPGDPHPLLATIGECDWMAEAWLIEREAADPVIVPGSRADVLGPSLCGREPGVEAPPYGKG